MTECVYDPSSDLRRKGVYRYREKVESVNKTQNSTLQVLIEAILNASDEDVLEVVNRIRASDNLDAAAEEIQKEKQRQGQNQQQGLWDDASRKGRRVDGIGIGGCGGTEGPSGGDSNTGRGRNSSGGGGSGGDYDGDDQETHESSADYYFTSDKAIEGEHDLAQKMGELRLENGSVRFIGGTSNLIYLEDYPRPSHLSTEAEPQIEVAEDPITSWSDVSKDIDLIVHLMNMYFNWHYPYFATLSKNLFYRDYFRGRQYTGGVAASKTIYCSPLLVNAMLALGCHFTAVQGAYAVPGDSWTKGDHFFAEAKRLIMENDEHEKPRLTTVQALALMSVREAGCGREAKGWVYSGMSFRMAQDLGLNLDLDGGSRANGDHLDEQGVDARRMTFWGCFLFDKCWSNYMGRLPQLPRNSYHLPKYDVFPDEDAEEWSAYTDAGSDTMAKQPSRTRAIGLQLMKLCEISSDLLLFFYHPSHLKQQSSDKSVELKKLSELHRRLEQWRKELPKELEPAEGQLPNVILVHMFFHLQFIHLFRPFLKYSPTSSPLPAHVSPRRICTANAGAISKLMRLYKKLYNLRQICNIAVYMTHSACTIHLLNLPEKTARRDITHGVRHLEEIAEDWLCARRTLGILSVLAKKWGIELPEEAALILKRTDERWGVVSTSNVPSPKGKSPHIGSSISEVAATTLPSPPVPKIGISRMSSAAAAARSNHEVAQDQSQSQVQHGTAPIAISAPQIIGTHSAFSPGLLQNYARSPSSGTGSGSSGTMQPGSNETVPASRAPDNGLLGSPPAWQQQTPQFRPRQLSRQPSSRPISMAASLSGTGSQYSFPTSPIQTAGSGSSPHTTPGSTFGLDGHDWYMKDGANWQSGFDGWDTNMRSSGGGSVPSIGNSPRPGEEDIGSGNLNAGTPGAAEAGRQEAASSTPSPGVFMFTGGGGGSGGSAGTATRTGTGTGTRAMENPAVTMGDYNFNEMGLGVDWGMDMNMDMVGLVGSPEGGGGWDSLARLE